MRLIDADALIKALGIGETCVDCQYVDGIFCRKSADLIDACDFACERMDEVDL